MDTKEWVEYYANSPKEPGSGERAIAYAIVMLAEQVAELASAVHSLAPPKVDVASPSGEFAYEGSVRWWEGHCQKRAGRISIYGGAGLVQDDDPAVINDNADYTAFLDRLLKLADSLGWEYHDLWW